MSSLLKDVMYRRVDAFLWEKHSGGEVNLIELCGLEPQVWQQYHMRGCDATLDEFLELATEDVWFDADGNGPFFARDVVYFVSRRSSAGNCFHLIGHPHVLFAQILNVLDYV